MKLLEKIKIISTIISLLAIPIIIAVIGNEYTRAQKEKEINIRFIELAVDILKSESKYESENLKKWAIQIINKYSKLPISIEIENDLKSITTWPTKDKKDLDYSFFKEHGEQLYKLGDIDGALSYFKGYKKHYDSNFDIDSHIKNLDKQVNN